MGQDAFVDVAYRGLEVGRRLKLREVGPHTAYVEVGTPMPVGTGLVIRTDAGLDIAATVIRVHEQVAGAEMPPGMRIRVGDLGEAAAGWWRDLVSRDDPQIPEAEMVPVPLPPLPPAESARPAAAPAPAPVIRDTVVMEAVDPAAIEAELAAVRAEAEAKAGNGASAADARHTASASHTVVMSAVELSEITDLASAESEGDADEIESDSDAEADAAAGERESSGNGTPGSNGDELQGARSRGRRRRRRR